MNSPRFSSGVANVHREPSPQSAFYKLPVKRPLSMNVSFLSGSIKFPRHRSFQQDFVSNRQSEEI